MPLTAVTDPEDVAGPDEKTVLDPKTNTTIAFPATMSDDEISHHMQTDPMAPSNVKEWNPDFYTKEFRPALESASSIHDPVIMAKSFINNAAQMASFNFYKPSPQEQAEEHALAPGSAMAGQLAGFAPWALAGQAINKYIGSLALSNPTISGFLSNAFTGAIAKFGLEGAEKASQIATGAAGSGALMAEYTGISDVSKKNFEDTAVDMAKQFGMWGLAGGITGAVAKPLQEMMGADKYIEASKQMATSGAVLAAVTKAQGGDNKDVLLAFGLGALAHGASLLGDSTEGRQAVIDDVQKLNTDYVQAKNTIVDPTIAEALANAHLQNEAQEVLDQSPEYQAWLQRNAQSDTPENPNMRVPLHPAEEGKAEAFKLPQEPLTEEEIAQNKMFDEGGPLPLSQIANSGELTNKLVQNIAKRVAGGSENATEGRESTQSGSNQEGAEGQAQTGVHLRDDGSTKEVGGEEVTNSSGQRNQPHQADNVRRDLVNPNESQLAKKQQGISEQQKQADNVSLESPLKENIPQESEEGKVSKAASDINAKMVKKGFDELSQEEQAKYTPITKEEQMQKVSDLINRDAKLAKDMASGRVPIEDGIHSQVLYNAVKNKASAEGDAQTLKDLAKSPLASERSKAAQTLGASGFDNGLSDHDPVKIIKDVEKSRGQAKPKDVEKTSKKMSDIINKTKPKLSDWASFVESIKCAN